MNSLSSLFFRWISCCIASLVALHQLQKSEYIIWSSGHTFFLEPSLQTTSEGVYTLWKLVNKAGAGQVLDSINLDLMTSAILECSFLSHELKLWYRPSTLLNVASSTPLELL